MESLTAAGEYRLPARRSLTLRLAPRTKVRIVNTFGTQVADTWAFSSDDPTEYMSMEHTRASTLRVRPRVGEDYFTNRRRPIVRVLEDSSPGVHDTLMPSCDRYRYEQLGAVGYHDNCADNLQTALRDQNIAVIGVPSPLNLFMHVPLEDELRLSFAAPLSSAGDYVVLRTHIPTVLIMSACPQDMIPVNGELMAPQDMAVVVESSD